MDCDDNLNIPEAPRWQDHLHKDAKTQTEWILFSWTRADKDHKFWRLQGPGRSQRMWIECSVIHQGCGGACGKQREGRSPADPQVCVPSPRRNTTPRTLLYEETQPIGHTYNYVPSCRQKLLVKYFTSDTLSTLHTTSKWGFKHSMQDFRAMKDVVGHGKSTHTTTGKSR